MKKVFDRIASYLTQSPTRFFFMAAILAFFVLWFVNEYKDPDGFSWHDVIVESHGLFFDLLVFGILLSVYDKFRERRDRIERLKEEIDDYRGWNEPEATYRIIGALRRLIRLKVSKINLGGCFLFNANLRNLNLKEANLSGAILKGTDFSEANLQGSNIFFTVLSKTNLTRTNLEMATLDGCRFNQAILKSTIFKRASFVSSTLIESNINSGDFERANLTNADLSSSLIIRSNFSGVNFTECDLSGSIIRDVNFKNAVFSSINLKGAIFENNFSSNKESQQADFLQGVLVDSLFFEHLEEWQVIGREAIIETYYIDENNRLQLKEKPS